MTKRDFVNALIAHAVRTDIKATPRFHKALSDWYLFGTSGNANVDTCLSSARNVSRFAYRRDESFARNVADCMYYLRRS